MELTVGVAVAYERLRSSERGRRVGAMVKLCSPPESREKSATTKCLVRFCISNQSICCYMFERY